MGNGRQLSTTRWINEVRLALQVLWSGADPRIAWSSAAVAAMVLCGGLLAGAGPLALKQLVDVLAHEERGPITLIGWALGYTAALSGGRLLSELRASLLGTTEQRLYACLKQRFFEQLLVLPQSWHLGRQTGAVVQRLEQGISGYQVLVASLVNNVLPVLVELATVAAVLGTLDQPLLVASFSATALAYLAVMRHGTRPIREAADAITQANLKTHGMLGDSLLNIEAVQCFNAEGVLSRRFAAQAGTLEQLWARWHRARGRHGLVLAATLALSMITSIAIALHAAAQGRLSVGGFVLANVYLLQVVRPLELLGAAVRDLSQSLAFIRPVLEVLEAPSERTPTPAGPPRHATQRPIAISFREVCFSYDEDEPVLQAFSLDIAAGRHVALVGASGSGKSTLVRLLLRLHEPQAGTILLGGRRIDTLPAAEVRSMIGLVPQDTVLLNASIAFNIGLGLPGAVQQDIEQAARLAGIHGFIETLPAGYATEVGERGLKLSGGERQRIAIARAVLRRPCLYIFDEATSMLDTVTEQSILRSLRGITGACTTLTVAHRLSTARHADEIVVLARGRVVERGDHASLLARSGVYAALWQAQQPGALEPASSR
jgi:ABC-type multidrug transport system fused ATPase/permease subunit